MTIVGLARMKSVRLLPLDPALALFNLDPDCACEHRLVDDVKTLIGLSIAAAEKFDTRFFRLLAFRCVRADEEHFPKAAAVVPKSAQPAQQFLLFLFVERRRKLARAELVEIVRHE